MDNPCDTCGLHKLVEKQVGDLEKKYGITCDRLSACEAAMHTIDMIKQDQLYLKDSLNEIKMLHRQAILEMRESLKDAIESVKKETIRPMSDRIARGEKIIYAMFFLLIGIAIKAFLGGV